MNSSHGITCLTRWPIVLDEHECGQTLVLAGQADREAATYHNDHRDETGLHDMWSMERQLTAEIEFWQELIANPSEARSEQALERMKLALALAEHKRELLGMEEPLQQRH